MRLVAAAALVLVVAVLAACGGSKSDPAAYCKGLRQAASIDRVLSDAVAGTDPSAARRALEREAQRFEDLVGVAPRQVRADTRVLVDTLQKYLRALKRVDPSDPTATRAALAAVATDLKRVEAAGRNVVAYAKDHCHIDLQTTTSSSTTVLGG